MPRWLSRTLLVILALVLIGGAVLGAFYLGQRAALNRAAAPDASEWYPRLDRDQVQPNLRDDRLRVLPWMPMHDRMFPSMRFPVIGFILGALWALVRLALLVLLVWVVVRFVLRTHHAPPPAPQEPPSEQPLV